jgi:hypothetical protein
MLARKMPRRESGGSILILLLLSARRGLQNSNNLIEAKLRLFLLSCMAAHATL